MQQREAAARSKTVAADASIGRWWWVATLAIAILSLVPLLLVGTLFWDDWTWLWVYRVDGARRLQEYMWQVAHPGYGPVFNLFFWLGGAEAGRLARLVAIGVYPGLGDAEIGYICDRFHAFCRA